MSKQSTILVVDDTADNRLLLNMLLSDDYQIIEASSGQECLDLVEQSMPDLILLDVKMPEMDGYQVCAHLRKQKTTETLPIIFVSALDSTEERLAGYEAGGDEYVIKPIDEQSLMDKISFTLERQHEIERVKSAAAQATSIAMEAMTSGSELGQIIEFVKSSQDLNTVNQIGAELTEIASQFGLSICALFMVGGKHYVGCDADSIEARLLDNFAHSTTKIVNAGIRTIISTERAVLLIKDMPLDDENRYGRLKDHLAVLVDISNSFLLGIQAQLSMADQRKDFLARVIGLSEYQIKLTSENIHKHNHTVLKTMQSMVLNLEQMLFGLGLDEDQEKKLMMLADNASTQLQESNESSGELDTELGKILEALYDMQEH